MVSLVSFFFTQKAFIPSYWRMKRLLYAAKGYDWDCGMSGLCAKEKHINSTVISWSVVFFFIYFKICFLDAYSKMSCGIKMLFRE